MNMGAEVEGENRGLEKVVTSRYLEKR